MKLPFYSVGYIGSLSSAYRERADIARKHGVALYLIETTKASLELLRKTGCIRLRYWTGESMVDNIISEPPPVFYDKSNSTRKNIRQTLIRALKERGYLFISDPDLREVISDKFEQYQLLSQHNLPTPDTALLSLENMVNFCTTLPIVFIKKRVSSQGRNQFVVKCDGPNWTVKPSGEKKASLFVELQEVHDFLRSHIDDFSEYIIQAGVDVDTITDVGGNPRVFDLRIVCQRGKQGRLGVTGCYMRIGAENSNQANISKKGHPHDPALVFVEWSKLQPKIYKLCLSIFRAFDYDLGELGVDLIMDKKGDLSCLEINTRPGSSGFRQMREWTTADPKHKKIGVIPYEYSNKVKALWGKRLRNFLESPFHYAKHLIDKKKRQVHQA